jgi:hypothetical protein
VTTGLPSKFVRLIVVIITYICRALSFAGRSSRSLSGSMWQWSQPTPSAALIKCIAGRT